MTKIYSDSSTIDNMSVATSLFLTESLFLNMITRVYDKVESPTEGELLSIVQSIRYMREEYPEEKNIELYCDCVSVVDQYTNILKTGVIPDDIKYRKRWIDLLEYSKGLNITAKHIQAHQETHNPNKICDRVSYTILQRLR